MADAPACGDRIALGHQPEGPRRAWLLHSRSWGSATRSPREHRKPAAAWCATRDRHLSPAVPRRPCGHRKLAGESRSLPESADELREIGKVFNAPATAIKLEKDATERAVKTSKLSDYRIVHFATHALVAGETARYSDMAEPALVFTPPQVPSDIDDGLLTSSEIAALNLNADWVILRPATPQMGTGRAPKRCPALPVHSSMRVPRPCWSPTGISTARRPCS